MNKEKLLNIQKVDKNTDLAKKLINFIENFSWEEIKQHMLKLVIK